MRREPHQLSNSFDTIHKPTLHEREMEKGRGGNDGNSSTLETERMMLLRVRCREGKVWGGSKTECSKICCLLRVLHPS